MGCLVEALMQSCNQVLTSHYRPVRSQSQARSQMLPQAIDMNFDESIPLSLFTLLLMIVLVKGLPEGATGLVKVTCDGLDSDIGI